jgi:hypothetical protein
MSLNGKANCLEVMSELSASLYEPVSDAIRHHKRPQPDLTPLIGVLKIRL